MPRLLPLALLLAATALGAQQDDSLRTARPERPTVATHAFAVARGYLEFEGGAARLNQVGELDAALILTSKLGVAERVQLTLTTAITHASPGVTAADPVYAGFKWQLTPERDGRPTFAVQPGVTFSNGPRRDKNAALSLMAIVSHTLGPVAMDLNVAATRLNDAGSSIPYLWAASFGGAVRGPLAWGLEFAGVGQRGDTPPVQMLGYLGYAVRPWFVLDAGWSSPPRGAGAQTVFAGATYNVGRVLPR